MADGNIFGTPPEPFFDHEKGCLPLDLLDELFHYQARCNEEGLQQGSCDDGSFKYGAWSETIFLICQKFKQPAETRYLAMEIFDRFMIRNIKNLHRAADTPSGRWHIPVSIWSKASRKCKKHILLYIVSCIQVASKMCSHYRILSCRRCCEFLRDAGVCCSKQSVLDSELCVLKTLDYKIHISSPITYVETLLEIMVRNKEIQKGYVNSIHGTSLQVLDVVYLKRPMVYSKLYEVVTGDVLGSKHDRDRSIYMCVERDVMLLAACVITAAAYILDRTTTHEVIRQLCPITHIPKEDIIDFATVLIVYCLS